MTWLLAAALGAGAALVQLGAAPALFGEQRAAPVLPLALIAGWGAVRGLPEATPAAVLAALTLGVASEERAGWFLLAMVPTAALLLPAAALPPSRQLLLAPLVAAVGAIAYQGLLFVSAGEATSFFADRALLWSAALWSGAAAAALAALCWPLRPRAPAGLFE